MVQPPRRVKPGGSHIPNPHPTPAKREPFRHQRTKHRPTRKPNNLHEGNRTATRPLGRMGIGRSVSRKRQPTQHYEERRRAPTILRHNSRRFRDVHIRRTGNGQWNQHQEVHLTTVIGGETIEWVHWISLEGQRVQEERRQPGSTMTSTYSGWGETNIIPGAPIEETTPPIEETPTPTPENTPTPDDTPTPVPSTPVGRLAGARP